LTILQDVLNKKSILCKERDLTAELYNLWITKMHDFQDDKYKYEMYLKMIDNLEPYANMIKEEIRVCNRKICEIEGVESIADTSFGVECTYKYGYEKPND
jgi:hypothetical protein